jgi:hypothetical protein
MERLDHERLDRSIQRFGEHPSHPRCRDARRLFPHSFSSRFGADLPTCASSQGPPVMRGGLTVNRAIQSGKLPMEDVDDRVRNVLALVNHGIDSGIPFYGGEVGTFQTEELTRKKLTVFRFYRPPSTPPSFEPFFAKARSKPSSSSRTRRRFSPSLPLSDPSPSLVATPRSLFPRAADPQHSPRPTPSPHSKASPRRRRSEGSRSTSPSAPPPSATSPY